MSLFPIRCFTCGKVLPNWDIYEQKLEFYGCPDQTLDKMKLTRFCCRRMYKSYVPEIEENSLLYSETTNIEGGSNN